ncbi:Maltose permease MAL31 [Daldinia childiae]|uniref:Maltose permease MAL31 n=1 Tax=Daldinia childiae TaxID=326645 RepID=UPI00144623EA|nr:Maltose permease MAL31 [Daldinia childiae]KAF3071221.1 Maltose permease MAL31 [Daldinia childiae]
MDVPRVASIDKTTTMVAQSDGPSKSGGADVALAEAVQREHGLSFWEAVKLYPTAVGWSAFVSIGVIMLAFDPQIVGNMFAMPQFQKDFGFELDVCHLGRVANWSIVGKSPRTSRWRIVLGLPLGVVRPQVDVFRLHPPDGMSRLHPILRALPASSTCRRTAGRARAGCFVVIGPTYASEVCPMALRGFLTSYTNLCFVTGQLLGNGITAGTASIENHWAYSIPFALQWFWVLIIIPGIFFIPESPWWLVRKGRMDDARDALRRLSSSKVNVDATLAVIAETDRLELEMEAGSTYLDTIKGINLRRTEISTGVYTTQVLSGIYLINYGTYFFEQAGLPTQAAFYMGIGFLGVGWVCTVLSWFLIARFGRRRIFNIGLSVLIVLMFIIGILDSIPDRPSGVAWAESSLMLVWNGAYDLSVGPITFVILGECSATRVRSKTIAVATAIQAVFGIAMTVAIPYMINPAEANMQGKLGYFFGGLGIICLIWSYFRIPETKGRTYEELDILFDRKVPARQFKGYQVDVTVIPAES